MNTVNLETLLAGQQRATKELIAHIESHVEANHDAILKATADNPAVPGTSQFCTVYGTARGILLFFEGIFFVPAKWRTVIGALIAGLDTVCPQQ